MYLVTLKTWNIGNDLLSVCRKSPHIHSLALCPSWFVLNLQASADWTADVNLKLKKNSKVQVPLQPEKKKPLKK